MPLQRLDDSVRRTGTSAIRKGTARRRPLRWSSALAIVIAGVGLVLQLVWGDARPFGGLPGYALLTIGFAVACVMPVLGPIKHWNMIDPPDHRERTRRRAAFLFTYVVIAVVAMTGLWTLLMLATVHGWDMTQMRRAMIALALFLMTLHFAGPTLHASWAER